MKHQKESRPKNPLFLFSGADQATTILATSHVHAATTKSIRSSLIIGERLLLDSTSTHRDSLLKGRK